MTWKRVFKQMKNDVSFKMLQLCWWIDSSVWSLVYLREVRKEGDGSKRETLRSCLLSGENLAGGGCGSGGVERVVRLERWR